MQALQLIQVLNSFNPFGAGRGLSTDGTEISQIFYEGLNPFRAGQGLSTIGANEQLVESCLNPFRAGRGLST